MTRTSFYLLGVIFGSLATGCVLIGHTDQWVSEGPPTFLVFLICALILGLVISAQEK